MNFFSRESQCFPRRSRILISDRIKISYTICEYSYVTDRLGFCETLAAFDQHVKCLVTWIYKLFSEND